VLVREFGIDGSIEGTLTRFFLFRAPNELVAAEVAWTSRGGPVPILYEGPLEPGDYIGRTERWDCGGGGCLPERELTVDNVPTHYGPQPFFICTHEFTLQPGEQREIRFLVLNQLGSPCVEGGPGDTVRPPG
jgi:hypothetical protein